ncbi:hypothetical protein VNO77_01629 [Canavalia gladiata]|uniref:Uncharacterized protein n=1 Tax=Canavalia gladiata TaxID=3824 RepID=A0AAN9MS66_CANGL
MPNMSSESLHPPSLHSSLKLSLLCTIVSSLFSDDFMIGGGRFSASLLRPWASLPDLSCSYWSRRCMRLLVPNLVVFVQDHEALLTLKFSRPM